MRNSLRLRRCSTPYYIPQHIRLKSKCLGSNVIHEEKMQESLHGRFGKNVNDTQITRKVKMT